MKIFRLVLAYPFVLIGATLAAIGAAFVFVAETINGGDLFEVKDPS